jgi:hypothetical protein
MELELKFPTGEKLPGTVREVLRATGNARGQNELPPNWQSQLSVSGLRL